MTHHYKYVFLNSSRKILVYATITETKNLLDALVISKSRGNMGVIQYKIEKLGNLGNGSNVDQGG